MRWPVESYIFFCTVKSVNESGIQSSTLTCGFIVQSLHTRNRISGFTVFLTFSGRKSTYEKPDQNENSSESYNGRSLA
jgi:hypothetical protein